MSWFSKSVKRVTGAVSDAFHDVGHTVKRAAEAVKDAGSSVWNATKDAADDVWKASTSPLGLTVAGAVLGGVPGALVGMAAGGQISARKAARQAQQDADAQRAEAERAAAQEAVREQVSGVGGSADYGAQQSVNSGISEQAAARKRQRRFSYSDTLNNTNLLGNVGGTETLG